MNILHLRLSLLVPVVCLTLTLLASLGRCVIKQIHISRCLCFSLVLIYVGLSLAALFHSHNPHISILNKLGKTHML